MFLPRCFHGSGTHVLLRWQMVQLMSSAVVCVLVLSVTDKQLLRSSATIVNIFLILRFFFGFVYLLIFFSVILHKPRSFHVQGQCPAAELHSQPTFYALSLHCHLCICLNLGLLYLDELIHGIHYCFSLTKYKGVYI